MNRVGALTLAFVTLTLLLAVPAHAADTVYYYSSDTIHSEVVVTDASRNVVERTYYAPYGQVLNRDLRDGPGYGGHEEDPETNLVYMQQRYYDPEAGRFLSVDLVQADAGGGSFNRYEYANDNPYRYMDPDGRQWVERDCGDNGCFPARGQEEGCPGRLWMCSLAAGNQPSARQSSRPAGQCDLPECDEYRQTNATILKNQGEALERAGLFAGKFAAMNFLGDGLGRLVGKLGKLGRFLGFASEEFSIGAKIEGQMARRGWSSDLVRNAISDPARTVVTRDTRFISGGERMNDPATAYYSREGGYVVRNDRTGDIVQVSDRNDPDWVAPWDH